VDVTAARRIIREQAEAVRALLGPLLADVGHQALAIADTTLTPRGWWWAPRDVLREAWRLMSALDGRWFHLTGGLHGVPDSRLCRLTAFDTHFRDDSSTITPARHHVQEVRKRLILPAEELIEGHGIPDRVITAPDDLHPPRHGHLKEGMLARLVAEDLAARIGAGRALEASLTRWEQIWPAAPDWVDDVNEVLAGLEPEVRISSGVFFGLIACESALVPGAVYLCRAYLVLALAYLEEVQERMPDYAQASGQAAPEPAVSVTVSGGTFYGGRFASPITNIDSVIAGALRDGGPNTADALTPSSRQYCHSTGWTTNNAGTSSMASGLSRRPPRIPRKSRTAQQSGPFLPRSRSRHWPTGNSARPWTPGVGPAPAGCCGAYVAHGSGTRITPRAVSALGTISIQVALGSIPGQKSRLPIARLPWLSQLPGSARE
jgi:hypothetical protein